MVTFISFSFLTFAKQKCSQRKKLETRLTKKNKNHAQAPIFYTRNDWIATLYHR